MALLMLLFAAMTAQAQDGPLARTLQGLGSGLDRSLTNLGSGLGDLLAPLDAKRLDGFEGAESFETSVEYQGVGRRIIYVRPPQDPPKPAPAIVLLHYSLATPERMVNVTRAEKLARRFGVWVILPQATLRHWPVDPNFSDQGEIGFISAVIHDATRRYPVDPDRVFLAGLSNGAFMVNRYLCQNTGLIAGAATVAATLYRKRMEQCATSSSVPMLLIQGTFDPFVPYNGSLKYLSAEQTYEYWRQRNGCAARQNRTRTRQPQVDDGSRIVEKENRACANAAAVRLFSVVHGGHAWPGGKIQIKTLGRFSPTSRNLDATSELWYFFSAFSRPQ